VLPWDVYQHAVVDGVECGRLVEEHQSADVTLIDFISSISSIDRLLGELELVLAAHGRHTEHVV